MFSVQCINHNVETVLDLSGMPLTFFMYIYCIRIHLNVESMLSSTS